MKSLKNKNGLRIEVFLLAIAICLLIRSEFSVQQRKENENTTGLQNPISNENSKDTIKDIKIGTKKDQSVNRNRNSNHKNNQNSEDIRYRRAQKKIKEAAELENKEAMSENNARQKAVELIHMTGSTQDLRKHLNQYPAQTVIETSGVSSTELDQLFYSQDISDVIKLRIKGKSYSDNCNVPYDELRYLRLLYWGVDKETHIGEMIVNKSIAEDVTAIFKELYEARYPIEKMVLVDEYDADDIASMEADNSSAFNFRFIDSTTKISIHSYGLAIDINPRYNPYIRQMGGKTVILPANGSDFADRSKDCQYYIKRDDICYQAFIKRGFTWGGDWKNEKDYQHFQKNLND